MGTFSLSFETDNAAFRTEEEGLDLLALEAVVSASLQGIGRYELAQGDVYEAPVMDANGNTVGRLLIDENS